MTAKIAVHIHIVPELLTVWSARRQHSGKEQKMRYKAVPETKRGSIAYVVIDTKTGEKKHSYDCFLWAEHKARELNEESEDENRNT